MLLLMLLLRRSLPKLLRMQPKKPFLRHRLRIPKPTLNVSDAAKLHRMRNPITLLVF
jgi:hypothetical protein